MVIFWGREYLSGMILVFWNEGKQVLVYGCNWCGCMIVLEGEMMETGFSTSFGS